MPKMRLFKFWNEAGDEKEKEAISLKKAIMSVQSDFKDKMISVEYISKKGEISCQIVQIVVIYLIVAKNVCKHTKMATEKM